MLTKSEKSGVQALLHSLNDGTLQKLKRRQTDITKQEIISGIIQATPDPLALLRRRPLKKMYLRIYLAQKGFNFSNSVAKDVLIEACLNNWGSQATHSPASVKSVPGALSLPMSSSHHNYSTASSTNHSLFSTPVSLPSSSKKKVKKAIHSPASVKSVPAALSLPMNSSPNNYSTVSSMNQSLLSTPMNLPSSSISSDVATASSTLSSSPSSSISSGVLTASSTLSSSPLSGISSDFYAAAKNAFSSSSTTSTTVPAIFSNSESGETLQAEEQQARLCKMCFSQSLEVLFLPCGHIATCAQCALKISACAICRAKISKKVRVYL